MYKYEVVFPTWTSVNSLGDERETLRHGPKTGNFSLHAEEFMQGPAWWALFLLNTAGLTSSPDQIKARRYEIEPSPRVIIWVCKII